MSDANSMDALDRLLREDARALLADDGFGARLMAALPPRGARERAWVKPALILGSVALGSALAAALAPGGASAMQGFIDLAQMRGLTPAAITGIALCAALLLSALVLAADTE